MESEGGLGRNHSLRLFPKSSPSWRKPSGRSFRKESRALARHAGSARYCASKEGGEGARRGKRRRSGGPCAGAQAAARPILRDVGLVGGGSPNGAGNKLESDVATDYGSARGRALGRMPLLPRAPRPSRDVGRFPRGMGSGAPCIESDRYGASWPPAACMRGLRIDLAGNGTPAVLDLGKRSLARLSDANTALPMARTMRSAATTSRRASMTRFRSRFRRAGNGADSKQL